MDKNEKWVELDTFSGSLHAELLRGLLEAQGCHVYLSQEGAGRSAYAVNVGPLSEVHLLVYEDELEQAKQILDDYYAGKFEEYGLGDTDGSNKALSEEE